MNHSLIDAANNATKKLTTAYVLSNGNLIDVSRLKAAQLPPNPSAASPKSNELQDQITESTEAKPIAEPPFDLDNLATIFEKSTTHYRAVKAKAEDAVARGWNIVSKTGDTLEKERQPIIDALNRINPLQTLGTILNNALIDKESLGNGYIEIGRNGKTGIVELINHIPGTTIRITKDMQLYVHKRGNKKVYFKRWKDPRVIEAATGDEKDVPFAERANELYPFINYHPRSDYYGIPDVIPALGAVLGDLSSRDYNLDFFENGAIPAYAVVIEGADLSDDLKKAIESFFKHDLKGRGNQHRTIIMPVPFPDVEVRFEKLNADIKEGSFKLYRQENRDEILSAHGVPPVRAMLFTSGALGRDISSDLDKIYQETTVAQLREMVEKAMTEILQDGMGHPNLAFKLNRTRFTDIGALGSFTSAVATSKALTPNELRELLSPLFENGLDRLDGGDDVYLDVSGVPTKLSEVGSVSAPAPDQPDLSVVTPADEAAIATNQDVAVTQDAVLNGSQIQAAIAIVTAVAAGVIPRDSGMGQIEVLFNLTPEQAAQIMGSAGNPAVPTTPNPNPNTNTEPAPKEPLKPAPKPLEIAKRLVAVVRVDRQKRATTNFYGHKMVDYDDVDFDAYEQYAREYTNVKDAQTLEAFRAQKAVVEETAQDLVKTFDHMLRAAFKALNDQSEKRFWKSAGFKAGGLHVTPILRAIESFKSEMKDNLHDAYAKALIAGARHAASQLNARFRLDGKAVVEIPDVEIEIDFRLRNPTVERYIEGQSDRISENITRTMSNRVRNQLQKGIEKGETNEQIADRLRKSVGVPGLRDSAGRLITAEVRALMIARTEVADAFNVGTLEGYRSTDGLVKMVGVRDGDDFDDECKNANGDEWTFRKAEDNTLEHPNCTRIFYPITEVA